MNYINLKIAFRNVIRQFSRSSIMITIVALCTLIISFIGGLYQYLFVNVEANDIKTNGHIWIEGDFQSSVDLSLDDILLQLENIGEIEDYTYRGSFNGVAGYGENSSIFSGKLYDKVGERNFSETSSVSNQIGKTLALNLGVREGCVISGFSSDRGFSFEVEQIVNTESEELDKYYIMIPFEYFTEEITLGDISSFHFHIRDVSYIEKVKEQLSEIFDIGELGGTLKIHTYSDMDSYTYAVRGIYQNNLYFIMIALGITIFFSLISLYSLIINERSNEFGTIKTLGTPAASIFESMILESSIIAVIGFFIGISVTLLLGYIINAFGGLRLPPPPTVENEIILKYVFTVRYMALALAEVLVISDISAVILSHSIVRKNIIQQLNGE